LSCRGLAATIRLRVTGWGCLWSFLFRRCRFGRGGLGQLRAVVTGFVVFGLAFLVRGRRGYLACRKLIERLVEAFVAVG
jgi:hypothetical protein